MIRFIDTSFSYTGEGLVLSDISLSIPKGQFVCVLGANGSGKSTFSKLINALLVPDAGEVRTGGLSTSDAENTFAIRSMAGMVLQNPDDQIVASLVESDVAFGPENLGIANPDLRARVDEALGRVGFSLEMGKWETTALSGGQKQRVAIAGVLAMRPEILILDEASAMLDPRGRRGLMRMCKELHAQGFTIVMITHFMEEAAAAERVIVLNAGRVMLDGAPDEVLTCDEELRALNLDVPFATGMSRLLEDRGLPVGTHTSTEALKDELVRLVGAGGEAGSQNRRDVSADKPSQAQEECPDGQEESLGGREERPGEPEESGEPGVSSGPGESGRPGAQEEHSGGQRPASATPPSSEPLVTFEGVSYAYQPLTRRQRKAGEEQRWALRDVSFSLNKGEFLAIAGHTGSGKSTLVAHLNGLTRPTQGRVRWCGLDLAQKQAAQQARADIGLVFQYPEHQLFAATVFDDVAFGPRNQGLSADEVELRVREALELVHLGYDEFCARSPFELSGGQQRRVAFAGVLAMRPSTLVLDEPVAGLDPASREDFLRLIEGFHRDHGLTVVMVSHNMNDIARLATRMLVLHDGRIAYQGTPEEIFTQHAAEVRAIGLGIPHAQRLANELRAAGFSLPVRLYSPESLADAICGTTGTFLLGDHRDVPFGPARQPQLVGDHGDVPFGPARQPQLATSSQAQKERPCGPVQKERPCGPCGQASGPGAPSAPGKGR